MSNLNNLYEILESIGGTWTGRGYGEYAGVPRFQFIEELNLGFQEDWNMIQVSQRTWLQVDGNIVKPLHLESGLIIGNVDGTLTYSCGQDSGRSEVMVGTLKRLDSTLKIDWITTFHANDDRLVRMGRIWTISGDQLSYEAFLSTVKTPEYRKHLEATLIRER